MADNKNELNSESMSYDLLDQTDWLQYEINEGNVNYTSPYEEINCLNDKDNTGKPFRYRAMHINIQSLPAKLDKLKNMLVDLSERKINIDFLMLCETFMKDDTSHHCNIPGYNLSYKNRSNKVRGGGVAIYVKECYNYEIRHDLSIFDEGNFESIFIEVNSKSDKLIVGEIYRIPNSNVDQSLEYYESTISKLINYKHNIIIGTDQNFDLLKMDSHKKTRELLNLFVTNKLMPTITKPTRITHSSATLIDNIYMAIPNPQQVKSGIIVNDISDHLPVIAFWGERRLKKENKFSFSKRQIDSHRIDRLNEIIETESWNYLDDLPLNEAYNVFDKKLQSILDSVVPEKVITLKQKSIKRDPWISKGLLVSSYKVQKLYKKQLKTDKNHSNHKKYIIYRNLFNKLKRKAKQDYYRDIFEQYKGNIKKHGR